MGGHQRISCDVLVDVGGCDVGGHPYARELGTKLFLLNVLCHALLAFELV